MQKTNFITHFFINMQRNSKLVILSNLSMRGHTDLMTKPLTFICMQKINFIFHVFFEILQRYWKLVILGTLDMPGYAHPKWYYQLVENVCAYGHVFFHCIYFDMYKLWKITFAVIIFLVWMFVKQEFAIYYIFLLDIHCTIFCIENRSVKRANNHFTICS